MEIRFFGVWMWTEIMHGLDIMITVVRCNSQSETDGWFAQISMKYVIDLMSHVFLYFFASLFGLDLFIISIHFQNHPTVYDWNDIIDIRTIITQ